MIRYSYNVFDSFRPYIYTETYLTTMQFFAMMYHISTTPYRQTKTPHTCHITCRDYPYRLSTKSYHHTIPTHDTIYIPCHTTHDAIPHRTVYHATPYPYLHIYVLTPSERLWLASTAVS